MNPHNKIVERVRALYPAGCRVELDSMNDPQAPPIGTKGTVLYVDYVGTIHVAWDNGSSIGVAFGEDQCHRIGKEVADR